jgi:hypothetical protein
MAASTACMVVPISASSLPRRQYANCNGKYMRRRHAGGTASYHKNEYPHSMRFFEVGADTSTMVMCYPHTGQYGGTRKYVYAGG